MKSTLMILISLFTIPIYAGEPDKELHEKCIYPTVNITSSEHYGTGVIVKSVAKDDGYENYVLTVAHLIRFDYVKEKYDSRKIGVGKYENWSKLVGYVEHPMEKVLYYDGMTDMALITFSSVKQMPVAKINSNPKLYLGNDICRVGCGLEEKFRVDYGKVTSVKGSLANAETFGRIRISIPTVLGDSGGPTYHEYELVGITESIKAMSNGPFPLSHVFHIAYVIPIERFTECPEIAKHLD